MKRFLIDLILIFILVVLGSSLTQYQDIDKQIEYFEERLEIPVSSSTNKVTWAVKKSGDTIENVISITVELISSIFKAVVE